MTCVVPVLCPMTCVVPVLCPMTCVVPVLCPMTCVVPVQLPLTTAYHLLQGGVVSAVEEGAVEVRLLTPPTFSSTHHHPHLTEQEEDSLRPEQEHQLTVLHRSKNTN